MGKICVNSNPSFMSPEFCLSRWSRLRGSELNYGFIGTSACFSRILWMLIPLNHLCPRTSSTSPVVPSRLAGSFYKSPVMKSLHSYVIVILCLTASGNWIFFPKICLNMVFSSPAWKGQKPTIISYVKIPKVHQSTGKPCPVLSKISGAKYSGVPHTENAYSFYYRTFAIPKSATQIYPLSSINTFSGLRSR